MRDFLQCLMRIGDRRLWTACAALPSPSRPRCWRSRCAPSRRTPRVGGRPLGGGARSARRRAPPPPAKRPVVSQLLVAPRAVVAGDRAAAAALSRRASAGSSRSQARIVVLRLPRNAPVARIALGLGADRPARSTVRWPAGVDAARRALRRAPARQGLARARPAAQRARTRARRGSSCAADRRRARRSAPPSAVLPAPAPSPGGPRRVPGGGRVRLRRRRRALRRRPHRPHPRGPGHHRPPRARRSSRPTRGTVVAHELPGAAARASTSCSTAPTAATTSSRTACAARRPCAVGAAVARGRAAVPGRQRPARATGPHLHFEIWDVGWRVAGGYPIDPLPELRAWAPRRRYARARRRAAPRGDILRRRGEIAQLVEHTTENRGVPGSSPGLAIAASHPRVVANIARYSGQYSPRPGAGAR